MQPRALACAAALGLLAIAAPSAAQQDDLLTLDEVVAELGDDPAVVEDLLRRLGGGAAAAGFVTPAQRRELLGAVRRGDRSALRRFPTLTVPALGEAVRLAGAASTARERRRRGLDPKPSQGGDGGLGGGPRGVRRLLREPLGIPTGGPPLAEGSLLKDLGYGLQYGDVVDPEKASRHPDSARLANLLNRLAENDPTARSGDRFSVEFSGEVADSVPRLLELLIASGHTVEVRDARYAANFGDLRFRGHDVATPFWLDTEVAVPGREGTLRVPAAHSQHEVVVRGPRVNADVSFFFGIDGKAEFRPMASRGQGWIGGVVAHVYRGERAIEAARMAGEVHRAMVDKQRAHPDLPYGGYYALGVCNDSNALVELHMTGKTTLYPLTRDLRYFQGSGEVDRLARRLPVDGRGAPLGEDGLRRVLGSIPYADLDAVPWPELREDLRRLGATGLRPGDAKGLAGQQALQGGDEPTEAPAKGR
ncbi:MAG: hypothetical protein D6731_17300 [Planctomycetota bacterium]|nr:MAG: hypothetical protein D6731_17300 [Planctomycetota bacterium]